MKLAKILAASTLVAAFGVSPALASPESEMCGFVAILSDKGVEAGVDYLISISQHWGEAQQAQLDVVIGAQMDKFTYKGGQVYKIADLTGSVEEFLLTLNLASVDSSVYARVLYEGDGGQAKFINFSFQSDFYELMQRPTLQTPVRVDCAAP